MFAAVLDRVWLDKKGRMKILPFYVYGSFVKYGVFQDCGGLLFRLHLHIQKLRNMTGVISETTEKSIDCNGFFSCFGLLNDLVAVNSNNQHRI